MKKFLIFSVSLFTVFFTHQIAFAQLRTDIERINGRLVSVDTRQNEVTLRDSQSGMTRTFRIKGSVDPSWKSGSEIKGLAKKDSGLLSAVKVQPNP